MKKLFCVFGVSATEVLIVFAKVAAVVEQEREFLFFGALFNNPIITFTALKLQKNRLLSNTENVICG